MQTIDQVTTGYARIRTESISREGAILTFEIAKADLNISAPYENTIYLPDPRIAHVVDIRVSPLSDNEDKLKVMFSVRWSHGTNLAGLTRSLKGYSKVVGKSLTEEIPSLMIEQDERIELEPMERVSRLVHFMVLKGLDIKGLPFQLYPNLSRISALALSLNDQLFIRSASDGSAPTEQEIYHEILAELRKELLTVISIFVPEDDKVSVLNSVLLEIVEGMALLREDISQIESPKTISYRVDQMSTLLGQAILRVAGTQNYISMPLEQYTRLCGMQEVAPLNDIEIRAHSLELPLEPGSFKIFSQTAEQDSEDISAGTKEAMDKMHSGVLGNIAIRNICSEINENKYFGKRLELAYMQLKKEIIDLQQQVIPQIDHPRVLMPAYYKAITALTRLITHAPAVKGIRYTHSWLNDYSEAAMKKLKASIAMEEATSLLAQKNYHFESGFLSGLLNKYGTAADKAAFVFFQKKPFGSLTKEQQTILVRIILEISNLTPSDLLQLTSEQKTAVIQLRINYRGDWIAAQKEV